MGTASGVSVKGTQALIGESTVQTGFLVRVDEGVVGVPNRRGFISAELLQGTNYYQIAGSSLWYQGLCIFLPPIGAQSYYVIAYWREAGLHWTVETF